RRWRRGNIRRALRGGAPGDVGAGSGVAARAPPLAGRGLGRRGLAGRGHRVPRRAGPDRHRRRRADRCRRPGRGHRPGRVGRGPGGRRGAGRAGTRPPPGRGRMNVVVWHVHGSWTTALVHGPHTWLVPVVPDRGPDGRGRARTWDWPPNAVEVTPAEARARADEVDVVILQRPEERDHLAEDWLGGRRPGLDVPAVYVEHNAPQGRVNDMRHPAADRPDLPNLRVVHVTHFNALFWDTGSVPTTVVEHGIVDPGYRYTGELPRAAVVVNEAHRRGRVTGTDLLPRFGSVVPVDLFGMDA